MKTADQAVHDALWKYLAGKLPVYESRPMKDVGYPFGDFEDISMRYLATKGRAFTSDHSGSGISGISMRKEAMFQPSAVI